MCDIWKGNRNLKQLTIADVQGLMTSLKHFSTRQVVMSGGEALLNENFFIFCEMLRGAGIRVTLLSTGLTLAKHAKQLAENVNDIIVSLDGDRELHDSVRNITGAWEQMETGIRMLRRTRPGFMISGRTVIHRLNFRAWPEIIKSAKALRLDRISFLPADVSSTAFNRPTPWEETRVNEIMPTLEETREMAEIIEHLVRDCQADFRNGFIAESPDKIRMISSYYRALHGFGEFPYKKCNAPWVSTVVEADGTVRPCFFHAPIGNIHESPLHTLLNSATAKSFRQQIDMNTDTVCMKCVCSLHLKPSVNPITN